MGLNNKEADMLIKIATNTDMIVSIMTDVMKNCLIPKVLIPNDSKTISNEEYSARSLISRNAELVDRVRGLNARIRTISDKIIKLRNLLNGYYLKDPGDICFSTAVHGLDSIQATLFIEEPE